MENYTITKEQVLKLANKAEQGCTSVIESDLKNWFPEAFKTELEVGKWYKMKGNTHFLCNFNGNIGNNGNSYGFNLKGKWMDNSMCFQNCDTYVEATPEEVESALINEAKKRGFIEGTQYLSPVNKYKRAFDGEMYFNHNNLFENSKSIFNNGIWATILPQKKTVVPMDKALKIIAKKMKVSPENIEIQS